MITVEEQQKLLLSISRRLKRPVTAYAVGGTAMMFLGFKDFTIDIDLVFENKDDMEEFAGAVKSIGYYEIDSIEVYGDKKNHPKMFTLGDERFDLFVVHVIDFDFSRHMIKRAEKTHLFNKKLFLKIADLHDILLMKCATDRQKDLDDARKIIESTKIDWNILIKETETQIKLGRHTAAFDLGEFLEKLKYKFKVNLPKEVLNNLYKIVKKQIEKKKKLNI